MTVVYALVHSLFSPRFIEAWHKTLHATYPIPFIDPTAVLYETARQIGGYPRMRQELLDAHAPTGDTPHAAVLDVLEREVDKIDGRREFRWPEIITRVFTEIALMQEEKNK